MDYFILKRRIGGYEYGEATSFAIQKIGFFLRTDVGCLGKCVLLEWIFNDKLRFSCNGNCTSLEKDGDDVLIGSSFGGDPDLDPIRMTRQQFVNLIKEWQEKVCKTKPQEVIIKFDNGRYWIETNG